MNSRLQSEQIHATTDAPPEARILLVEDSPSLRTVYASYLAMDNYEVDSASSGGDALNKLERGVPDLVLLDLRLPDISGMDVLRHIHEQDLGCAVIIITAHGSIDTAVVAMRYGAVDFVVKPFDAARLRVTVANVLEKCRLSNIVTHYQKTFDRDRFHRFIGTSLPMQAVYRIIENAGPSRATVFVTGESGTGKELCAEAIHQESTRRTQPFVALNCAAIPRDLMESEIFGHIKGAFTGAVGRRDGAASRADGGTLFLDEICEMDFDLQSKLLRFIQTGRFQRVGDSKEEQVDIRIVCATNRDPLAEVKAGRFREDLYYRLNVIPIHLPPLRDRGDDVLLIAGEMLQRTAREENKGFKGFSPAVANSLAAYAWPGNVRELENVIRNVVVLNEGEQVGPNMLPATLMKDAKPTDGGVGETVGAMTKVEETTDLNDSLAVGGTSEIRPLWLEEKDVIERAVALCGGNIPKAAALLDISASTVYRKRNAWRASANREDNDSKAYESDQQSAAEPGLAGDRDLHRA